MELQVSCNIHTKKEKKGSIHKHKKRIGENIPWTGRQKESKIIEGSISSDHVHMCIEIPPKHSVSSIIGFLKGKSAIAIARTFQNKQRNIQMQISGPEDMPVSTVGFDEEIVRKYIREQADNDSRL